MTELPIRREVLDHGYVELVDMMPRSGYLISAVADAARVSYGEGTRSFRDDQALVEYMLVNGHWSPFDQVKFKFIVHAPNFVRDQWFRHWSWDFNAESARYSQIKEVFYLPEPENIQRQSLRNKQSRSGAFSDERAQEFRDQIEERNKGTFDLYRRFTESFGLARELARMILPHGMYTKFQATTSLRDLAFFLKQRLDPHAQWEIRQYAQGIYDILLEVDTEAVNLLENYVLGARTLSAREILLIRNSIAVPGSLKEHSLALGAGLSKRELDHLEGVLSGH